MRWWSDSQRHVRGVSLVLRETLVLPVACLLRVWFRGLSFHVRVVSYAFCASACAHSNVCIVRIACAMLRVHCGVLRSVVFCSGSCCDVRSMRVCMCGFTVIVFCKSLFVPDAGARIFIGTGWSANSAEMHALHKCYGLHACNTDTL